MEQQEPIATDTSAQLAVVFPGQGAQRAGMGKDLCEHFEVARRTFEEASEAIGLDLAKLCFGDDPRLHQTSFTQPCLLTVEYAAYRVAVEAFGLEAHWFGGHSLGEYTALLAAGVMSLADAAALVYTRGQLMQEAVPVGHGGMAALVMEGIESSAAAEVIRSLGAEVANRNSPNQLVVSGTRADLEQVRTALAEALPDLDYVPLKVSAPFHSRFMRPIVPKLLERLEASRSGFRSRLAARVTSNLTGGFHEPDQLASNLAEQVGAPVLWRDNMAALCARAGRIVEFGPRGSLSRFFRAAGHAATALSSAADFATYFAGRPGRSARKVALAASPATPVVELASATPRRAASARYVIGGMGRGVGSVALVVRAARAGFLAFLGSAGVADEVVEREILRVRAALPPGAAWGLNVTRDVVDPARADRLVDLAVRHGIPALELAGFPAPTAALVRARLAGLQRVPDGRPRPARSILVKVSDESAARRFLAPPPPGVVAGLVAEGLIEREAAVAADTVSMADDLCAAAGWGEDPGFQAQLLLPVLSSLSRELAAPGARPRVGLAGGLGSPESIAAAFAAGAAFVLTGSVNLCTVEAGLGDEAKTLLASADLHDFAQAPDVDRFELGGRVQVLKRGLTFAARANALEQLWRRHRSFAAMPSDERRRLETLYQGLEAADSSATTVVQIRRWLEGTLRRAVAGDRDASGDLQVQSGPAIASFNRAVRGSPLADWRTRHVDDVARFLVDGAAQLLATARMSA